MSSVSPPPETLDLHLGGERRILDEKPSTGIRVRCSHDRNGRIIVISADGTSNEFGEKSTNVVEFYSRIVKGKRQITFYISGIGTHSTFKLGRIFDLAFANSFERNVLLAYKWLAENYEPGDRIFLFGFSRGAYQVRVIAGMIERVGLIYPGNNTQLPAVYKLYMSTTERSSGKGTAKYNKAIKLCGTFKKAFSQPDVKVHFVGVWDTVSSIGLTRGSSLPETVTGMSHVCHFRHALALDERRVRFWPEYASTSAVSESHPEYGDVKEVWFAGSHSDM
ncbi:T6SS Phospholipase effector Tle1-like catalytic domain-containing protein [Pleurotus pulmonarius]